MLSRRHAIAIAVLLPTIARAATPLKVVASFSILGDLVREVGRGRVVPIVLVGADQDAHSYQPKPSDLRAVASANLLVTNGLGFEGWMDRMANAAGFKGTRVVASAGILPLKTADGSIDPHAFQNVGHVMRYVANLRDGLVAADPPGTDIYQREAGCYLDRLAQLDSEIRAAWAPIPRNRRRIMTSHDALGYYGAGYGVTFLAPQGLSTESEPSAKELRGLIAQIRAQQVSALFIENISNGAILRQIAREAGAKVGGTLFTDALSVSGGPAATYLDMMRHNTAAMVAAAK
ncbi:MAG: zinc ABC transporter substrate-binding protein [Acetobacteraceae bacterium]|nr:zinc ABC transporter substrate-binding protein [Acetobacteraceae bacterium]